MSEFRYRAVCVNYARTRYGIFHTAKANRFHFRSRSEFPNSCTKPEFRFRVRWRGTWYLEILLSLSVLKTGRLSVVPPRRVQSSMDMHEGEHEQRADGHDGHQDDLLDCHWSAFR